MPVSEGLRARLSCSWFWLSCLMIARDSCDSWRMYRWNEKESSFPLYYFPSLSKKIISINRGVASGQWRCFASGGLGGGGVEPPAGFGAEPGKFFEGWHFWMQETNNFTNLTRLSSFLLLDMLLLIDMTWNTHLSAKNTERKRNILGDRKIDKRGVDRQKTQILNDARPNRVQTYAEGSAWSVAVACLSWASPSAEHPEAQHGCTIAFAG